MTLEQNATGASLNTGAIVALRGQLVGSREQMSSENTGAKLTNPENLEKVNFRLDREEVWAFVPS